MKNTPALIRTGLQQAALLIGLGLCHGLAATATFTVTPSAVSNTYTGTITLQIGGLTNGETVVVQEFLDLNTNGVVEASDWLAQQFQLTDGLPSTIGGIVNSNVPADTTATNGAITARFNFQNNHVQSFIGKYLFRLSSPAGHFNPITSSFTVTNLSYVPGFKGTVKCGSTNVPNALVLLFKEQIFSSSLQAGAVADNSGNYLIKAPPGTYGLVALKNNYLPNTLTAPVLTLTSTTRTTNLSLVAATDSVAGKMVDAANPGTTLPGILVSANGPNDSMAISFTDANGNFTLGVTSGQWEISADDVSLIAAGYVGSENRIIATAGQTGLTLAEPKATALFYGTVKDGSGKPIPRVDVYARDDNDDYETDGYSDANGNYFVAVLGGLNNDPWHLNIGDDSSPSNYVYPEAPFELNGGTNLTVGQTVRADFVALLATNQISGYLKDSATHPISNVWIWTWATINNVSYGHGMDTDANGHYAINVCNGAWWVGVSCGEGSDSLGSQYQCPSSQMVTIANKNTNINFTALLPPSQISGTVRDNNNNPVANVGVYAYPMIGGNGTGATTDANGHYWVGVANGGWNVGLSCCGDQSLSPLGYLCVGEQSTTVNNSASTVNFTVPRAPYQITGHVSDTSNNPIANVTVNADGSSYHACATTVGDGSYTLYVTSDDWYVSLDCGALSSLGYLCPDGVSINIAGANVVTDFTISPVLTDGVEYYVMKTDCFRQLDDVNLVPDTDNGPFAARMEIFQSGLGAVPFASVTLPSGGVRNFPPGSSGIELAIHETYPSQGAFDAVYANGNYTFSMATVNNGSQYPVLAMPVAVYPAAPRVSNFTAAQAINPANPFTLQWSNPPDAKTNDVIWVYIVDAGGRMVFSTPYPPTNQLTRLKGTATSVEVPANTFQPGVAYTGVIGFYRVTGFNTTSYPGALGVTLVAVETAFSLASPSALPVLSQPARISDTQFGFLLSGAAGTSYKVLASTNAALPLANWSTVLITNLSTSPAFIRDNQATTQRRFYRVKVGP